MLTGVSLIAASLPLMAAVLGALLALVPWRGVRYRVRAVQAARVLLIPAYGLMAAMGIVTLARIALC